ncbi:MAG TPA: lysophospholipid acyltransferase family protein [Pseudonocardiaceae bacterium]|nr:lysophospholipid acyltransferase family protein [Pseudonocardiaceae bacterium]
MGLIQEVKTIARNRDWRGRVRTPRSATPYELIADRVPFSTSWARLPVTKAVRAGLQRGVLKPITWTTTRPRVEGLDYLDGLTGQAVFVANHASHLDTPLIIGSLPTRLSAKLAVGAAADYFFDARWRAVVTALVFNAFPVDRHGGKRVRSILPMLLDQGWSLLLFPESSRSQDGWMSPFRLGTAHVCCTRRIPAVPVALLGTFGAMPRGRRWPVPGRREVMVRYGRPLLPAPDENARTFNERLHTAVARLWAEEEIGWYRALRSEPAAVRSRPAGPAGAEWRRIWESTRPLNEGRPVDTVWRVPGRER